MNPPCFTAEAVVYRTREAYRTAPVAGCGTGPRPLRTHRRPRHSMGPHQSYGLHDADAKADLSSSRGGQSWTPELADAAEAK